jgi:3-oxoacyl-[acyl-carrier-protein] synthase I
MAAPPIAIEGTGLVTSVGLSAPAACAAIRAKISNPTETRFMGRDGEWIMAHQVPLEKPWRGRTKLAKMAAMAIAECLDPIPQETWPTIPLVLCVAERERPGRLADLDDQLLAEIEEELGLRFPEGSAVIPQGRVSAAIALAEARKLLYEGKIHRVVVAATDSLVTWSTLDAYQKADRLLTAGNSNGFIPGEAAGAILVSRPTGRQQLRCLGVGHAKEAAHIESGEPLRADGLTAAIRAALSDADCELHDIDCRIADISGEQYYFKEAALALSRVLRRRKGQLDLWHPAECIGEAGAAAGVAAIAVAEAACRKAYSPGVNLLTHFANDAGRRSALVLSYREP